MRTIPLIKLVLKFTLLVTICVFMLITIYHESRRWRVSPTNNEVKPVEGKDNEYLPRLDHFVSKAVKRKIEKPQKKHKKNTDKTVQIDSPVLPSVNNAKDSSVTNNNNNAENFEVDHFFDSREWEMSEAEDNLIFQQQQGIVNKFWKLCRKFKPSKKPSAESNTDAYENKKADVSNAKGEDNLLLWGNELQPPMYDDGRYLSQMIWQMESANNTKLQNAKLKTILIYDQFKWWGQPSWKSSHKLDNCLGGFSQCVVVENPYDVKKVDAVVTVRDFFHYKPVNVPSNVLKFSFILESPFAASANLANQNERLASYWRGSDIVTPYFKWVYYDSMKRRKKQTKNYAEGKTKLAAIFVSNCHGVNNRLGYVKQLQKFMQVDVYGSCGTLHCPRRQAASCFEMLKKDYLFYLAFENSNCRDYITEKLFDNAFKNNVVPVVLGAHPDDYATSTPQNSYIHVEDFDSPEELASYLKFLQENPAEYNKYFEWIDTGEFVSNDFFCRVCSMVHYADITPAPTKTKKSLKLWNENEAVRSQMCLPEGKWYWISKTEEKAHKS